MKNKGLLYVLGGCAVLLILCCLCSVVGFFFFGSQLEDIQSEILGQLGGDNGGGLVVPTFIPQPTVATAKVTPVTGGTSSTSTAASKVSSSSSSVASSAASAGGNPFSGALGKAKSASKYRMQVVMSFGSTTSGKFAEEALFDLTGEVDGASSHFTSKGGFMALLTGDAAGTVEFITAGGKTYMKGVKMFGLTDPKVWYVTNDNSTSGGMEDLAKPDAFQDYVSNPADFKKVGTEAVDGQQCDIWSGPFSGMDTSMIGAFGGKDSSDVGVIDKSEMRIWLCGDGYVHKFLGEFQGHNAKTPTEKGSFKISAHLWDFNNAAIKVTAPTDAKPFPGQ